MIYRREIDGLRALAVLPVIFFHAGFEAFAGGFVGVDVFFVISGYLITSIILEEKQSGIFSLADFYKRRARRILPALFVVMAVCVPLAWMWLLPADFKQFSSSIAAVSVFASNIQFWMESGYFDSAAELKPLLHTWSLAVEEQFYILFPLLLLLAGRLEKRWVVGFLATLAAISLTMAEWHVSREPAATFFLFPTRAWELLIGVLTAFCLFRPRESEQNRWIAQILGIVGLALILYSVFAFSKKTPFPSLYALAPTIGTVLVILFATPATFAGKALGNKALVAIGLISYSTYLWHQPLFSFARHLSIAPPDKIVFFMLIALALLLAYFTYIYIEKPCRKKPATNRIYYFYAFSSLLFATLGLLGSHFDGFPGRMASVYPLHAQEKEKVYKAAFTNDTYLENERSSDSRLKPTVLIVGDSYIMNWSIALNQHIDHEKYRVVALTYLGCDVKFVDGAYTISILEPRQKYLTGCNTFLKYINDSQFISSIEKIILVSHRPFSYVANQWRFEMLADIQRRSRKSDIYIFGNYYQLPPSMSCLKLMHINSTSAQICRDLSDYPKENSRVSDEAYFSKMKAPYHYIDIIALGCRSTPKECPIEKSGVPFMLDWNHLTVTFLDDFLSDVFSNKNHDFLKNIGFLDILKNRE